MQPDDARVRAFLLRETGLTAEQVGLASPGDRAALALWHVRARQLASIERKLMFEAETPEHLPFTRASRIRAIALLALTVIVVVAFCGLFGRIFL